MKTARIAIVGGGLSGLYAAYLLQQQGIKDYLLLEAHSTLGGRIASVDSASVDSASVDSNENPSHQETVDSFDLGATWFWPSIQPQLARLINELNLESFPQYGEGDLLIETADLKLRRMRVRVDSPAAMRLKGSMSSLSHALRDALEPSHVFCGQRVKSMRSIEGSIHLLAEHTDGKTETYRVESVLLATPPRLAINTIEFEPNLPADLAHQWQQTATWMAPHAKYVAVYARPFWQEQGLLGEARSGCGPLVEIHDASIPAGNAALFGFLGWPHHIRQQYSYDELRQHCRNQLVRMFGAEACEPKFDVLKDWANESLTATAADLNNASNNAQHDIVPSYTPAFGIWHNRLIGIASEWSPQFSGYLAGAIEAAMRGVQIII